MGDTSGVFLQEWLRCRLGITFGSLLLVELAVSKIHVFLWLIMEICFLLTSGLLTRCHSFISHWYDGKERTSLPDFNEAYVFDYPMYFFHFFSDRLGVLKIYLWIEPPSYISFGRCAEIALHSFLFLTTYQL